MFVPQRVVTNNDLKAYYDTSDEWIYERSGIRERRWVDDGVETGASDLAKPAVEMALANAGLSKDDIDLMIFATLSPDADFPGSGVFLQVLLGMDTIPCLDIRQQCSGFIYGMSIAEKYVLTGAARNVLVVGAEVHSTGLDLSPEGRTVGVLFGDGAGCAIVSAGDGADGRGIKSTYIRSQGEYAKILWVEEPTSRRRPRVNPDPASKAIFPYMEGKEVFKHAIGRMIESITAGLKANGWRPEDVALYVPHQANARIAQMVAQTMGLPQEKFFLNIHKYGNTTAASIPIALHEAIQEGRAQKGDKVMLFSFGSGFTWGSCALVL
jgi:3-oxoacyl-[acyl-carrier-protein] synthase-3